MSAEEILDQRFKELAAKAVGPKNRLTPRAAGGLKQAKKPKQKGAKGKDASKGKGKGKGASKGTGKGKNQKGKAGEKGGGKGSQHGGQPFWRQGGKGMSKGAAPKGKGKWQ